MFSALDHLKILGHEINTHEIEDNTAQQYTMGPKLNDTGRCTRELVH